MNTLALAANARAVVTVATAGQLQQALAWAHEQGLPVVPLGQGSNVVWAGDVNALVIQQAMPARQLLCDEGSTVVLRFGAGENWHQLVAWSLQQGYFGLENLALIPGTAGAAPIQNIGAYGVELDTMVERVHAIAVSDGSALSLSRGECEFGYRDSVFKHRLRDQLVITAVDLRLQRQGAPQISYPVLAQTLAQREIHEPSPQDVFDTVVAIRGQRLPDPAVLPNAGSFFKNPLVSNQQAVALAQAHPQLPQFPQADGRAKLAAAWLIEQCGWKGHREHGIGVHPGHALVMVNYGGNDGRRLLALAQKIQLSVQQRFAVGLEIEPRVYGL